VTNVQRKRGIARPIDRLGHKKKIGFLSFGHWTPSLQSQTHSAADVLLQSIELAVAAEELGADGAFFRVHHFARQFASSFPLLAAVGAKTPHRDWHGGNLPSDGGARHLQCRRPGGRDAEFAD
jgi:hypothetical protein